MIDIAKHSHAIIVEFIIIAVFIVGIFLAMNPKGGDD